MEPRRIPTKEQELTNTRPSMPPKKPIKSGEHVIVCRDGEKILDASFQRMIYGDIHGPCCEISLYGNLSGNIIVYLGSEYTIERF